MFLQNAWYVVGFTRDLVGRALVSRRILNRPVLLWRSDDGRANAFEDRCPHRLVPLSAGRHLGDGVQCGYHGLRFEPNGRCRLIPGQDQIPATANATTVPLVERQNLLWLWAGDPALADETAIPDLRWIDNGAWAQSFGYTHVAADYRLLTDNLLDLSHESYIHESTIGNEPDETIAAYPVNVSVDQGKLVRAEREMLGIRPPPFFAKMMNSTEAIDRHQHAIWMPPALNVTDVYAVEQGGPRSLARNLRVFHLLTPETEISSHYFWVVCRNFRTDDDELTTVIGASVSSTFDEDKAMLGMQQRELLDTGNTALPKFAIKLDDAPMRARRILASLQKREREDPDHVVILPPLFPNEKLGHA